MVQASPYLGLVDLGNALFDHERFPTVEPSKCHHNFGSPRKIQAGPVFLLSRLLPSPFWLCKSPLRVRTFEVALEETRDMVAKSVTFK